MLDPRTFICHTSRVEKSASGLVSPTSPNETAPFSASAETHDEPVSTSVCRGVRVKVALPFKPVDCMSHLESQMNLDHIDLPVADTRESQGFFTQYFGFKPIFSRADGLVVLLDEDGFALTLSPLMQGSPSSYPEGFHVGLNVDSEHELHETHSMLASAGVPIARPIGELGGAMVFHCHAPGSILVEISYRPRASLTALKKPRNSCNSDA